MGKTSDFYKNNPAARKKRLEYQRKYNKSEKQKKYRAELNKANRDAGTYGNGDKKDAAHGRDGSIQMQPQSKNRKFNGSGRVSKYSR